jgi:hypothetical protein
VVDVLCSAETFGLRIKEGMAPGCWRELCKATHVMVLKVEYWDGDYCEGEVVMGKVR